MKINVFGGAMSQEEKKIYADYLKEKYPEKIITAVDLKIDGDYVEMSYEYDTVPFERIRRITGYLTGTVDRWNNAKQAELADRVKHSNVVEIP
jgi:hypothetical protein